MIIIKRLSLPAITALALAVSSLSSPLPTRAEKLVILHTNDTHSQIDPADDGLGGVARRKVVIDSVRDAHPNVLLIDAGDIVQGTPYFNLYKGELEEKLMNALDYDIRILGNHEFDNGLQTLAQNLKMADAELLASNYGMRGTPLEDYFKPFYIEEYGDKRIAFMPINLQPKGMISSPNYAGMTYTDAIEAANNLAWVLKHILQADAVIAITHIGYDVKNNVDDIELIKSSRDIDMVIGAHSHTLINPDDPASPSAFVPNADGREILVTQTGKSGKYIGEIVIDLDRLADTPSYRLIRIDERLDSRVDPAIEAIIAPYREKVDALNNNIMARTAKAMAKDSEELLNFVSDFIDTRGRQLTDNIDLAIVNQGGIRAALPKGNVSEGQLLSMMPFFNRVMVIEVPGDSLIKAFDIMPASGVRGVSANVDAVYDPDTYKCASVKISGKPIDPARTYRIATIDYIADGGDYMAPLVDHKTVAVSDKVMFDDLRDYLTTGPLRGKKINPPSAARMRPLR